MKARLLTILSARPRASKVKHYLGAPPQLTGGTDTRQEMKPAVFLIIQEHRDGFFLYRYDANGNCVGDTWHMNIDDARNQAGYEYGELVPGWQEVPPDVENAIAFGVARVRTTSAKG